MSKVLLPVTKNAQFFEASTTLSIANSATTVFIGIDTEGGGTFPWQLGRCGHRAAGALRRASATRWRSRAEVEHASMRIEEKKRAALDDDQEVED